MRCSNCIVTFGVVNVGYSLFRLCGGRAVQQV